MQRDAVILKVSTPTRRLWLLATSATALLAAIAALPAAPEPVPMTMAVAPAHDLGAATLDEPGCAVPARALDFVPRELETRWYEDGSAAGVAAQLGGDPPAWASFLVVSEAMPRAGVASPVLSLGAMPRTDWTPVEDRHGGIWLVAREVTPDALFPELVARRVWLLPHHAPFRGVLDASYRPLLVLP